VILDGHDSAGRRIDALAFMRTLWVLVRSVCSAAPCTDALTWWRLRRVRPEFIFFCGSVASEMWIESVHEELQRRGASSVILISWRRPMPNEEFANGAMYFMSRLGARLLTFFLRCRVFVTATSGMRRSALPRTAVSVHVPHSLVSLHMVYPKGAFDHYDYVFACGEHHIAEIAAMYSKHYVRAPKPLLVGYGKSDSLCADFKEPISVRSGRHVVIAPSWGEGNILETMGVPLIGRLLGEGWHVTVRPHPALWQETSLISTLRKSFSGVGEFTMQAAIGADNSFLHADALISDYSGIALEFSFTADKPVLFVDVPRKVLNQDWSKVGLEPVEISLRTEIGLLVPADVDAVVSGLAMLQASSSAWLERIRRARAVHSVNHGAFTACCTETLMRMSGEGRAERGVGAALSHHIVAGAR
jgi:hypothetical protein